MTSQQLLTIIFIAIVANAVLIGLALISIRNARTRRAESSPVGGSVAGSEDIVSRLEQVVTTAGPQAGAPRPSAVAAGGYLAADTIMHVSNTASAVMADDFHASGAFDEFAQPTPLGDPLMPIELESPTAWRRRVDEEVVRSKRYHRVATVMLVELDGFEHLTSRLGDAAGERLLVATARTLLAQARASDRCSQLGRGRFAILLPETDDIKAINFAERVRSECDRWLEAGEISMRVAIGWALLDPAQGAGAAIEAAERRLDAERRHRTGSAA